MPHRPNNTAYDTDAYSDLVQASIEKKENAPDTDRLYWHGWQRAKANGALYDTFIWSRDNMYQNNQNLVWASEGKYQNQKIFNGAVWSCENRGYLPGDCADIAPGSPNSEMNKIWKRTRTPESVYNF